MRIATWNVNSIKQRVDNVVAWLKERDPDVVCLQETKCVDEAFPREPFEALGYNVAVHGQKTFNGVAILSKLRFDEVTPRLPGDDEDDHARFLEVAVTAGKRAVRIASIYLPNGNPPDTDKYPYKLRWMDRLLHYAHERMRLEEPLVLAGDYNVIPAPADVLQPRRLDRRRAVPAADAGAVRRPHQPRPHRGGPGDHRCGRALHVLGLPGRRLAEELGHPHRPPAAVAARPPTRWPPPASTSTCAAGKSRPITCRCGSSWSSAIRRVGIALAMPTR